MGVLRRATDDLMTPSPTPLVESVSDVPLEWIGFLGGVIGALIGAGVAALLTYVFTRRHSIRTERREAYAKFLRFIDHIPTNIIFEVGSEADIEKIAPHMVRSIKDSEIELELIQSSDVCRAVDDVYEVLITTNTAGLLTDANLKRIKGGDNVADLVMAYRDAIAETRTRLVQAMRKDLGVRPLPDEHFGRPDPAPDV